MKAPKTQILFLTAAVVFASAVVRLSYVENIQVAEACRQAGSSFPCLMRQGLVWAFHFKVFGWLGIFLAFASMIRPHLFLAAVALILSALALVFYQGDLGAGGFVLGLIGLARAGHRTDPAGGEDRSRTPVHRS